MRKVIFVRSNPVCPDPRVEKEVDCLNEAGYSVNILAWDRAKKYRLKSSFCDLPSGKVQIFRFGIPASFGAGMRNLFPFAIFQIRLFIWLCSNRKKYEVIHACDFDTALTSIICAKLLRKKLVFDIFDYLSTNPNNMFRKIIQLLENSIINGADGVIICTEQRRGQIHGTKPKRLAIIHNSPQELPCKGKLSKDQCLKKVYKIAYVGILQDYRLLIEISEVIVDMKNVELHIGGFGKYEDYFEQLSKKYDNIKYYGKLLYDETIELERNCDIMTAIYDPAIGNHYYAAPNKFYEALMLGKPLIMAKETGMSDVVKDNKIGVLIDFSKEGFGAGLAELISQEHRWDDISFNMQQIYREQFSWDEMKFRLISFYNDI